MTKLLIVEDSATQAVELSLLLESHGFEVVIAKDGLIGLERCRAGSFDAVLSDVVMPGMDGYELCRQIKASPHTAGVPVILLTALGDPLDIIRGLECGADNFITKPYESTYLLERIRGLLENKALRNHRKLAVGVDVVLMGKRFTINSEKEQMVDLLISTFEEVLRSRQREYEAKLCEETVRESHRFLQSALDALSTQIVIIDGSMTLVAANQRWRAFADSVAPSWPDAGVGANYFAMGRQAFRTDREFDDKVRAGLLSVLRGELKVFSHEHSWRQDHKWHWFNLIATRFEERGTPLLAVEHEDVTARKQLEQQFLQAQKMEAVGQLAGGVAHDFNNLLLVIGGYAELLAKSIEHDPALVADVNEISHAVEAASALTQQLLAFSRQQRLSPAVLNINQVLGNLEKMMRRLIGEDVEYVMELDDATGMVNADPGQIQQVLMNLVVNARDAMPGGGRITVSTQNARMDTAVADGCGEIPPGRYVVLCVSDTGHGMDDATRARIFEPFFTTKDVGKGTGLGLSTVYGITRQSGGHVWVYSEPGLGTTFKVYLPRVDNKATSIPAPPPDQVLAAPRDATILVVEDNAAVRDWLRRVLSAAGYEVRTAGDPTEAREICRDQQQRIDVLLSDVIMPNASGPALVRELRAVRPSLAVILMSGYSGATLAQREDTLPDAAFLEKPFGTASVLSAVRQALETPRSPLD